MNDEGQVDWTTWETGVGVWAIADHKTLKTRFASGEVDLPPGKDYSDWTIKHNHLPEEAVITNGHESLSLWPTFRAGLPSARRIAITGFETRPSLHAIADGPTTPSPTDTLAIRRRLLRRVSSNGGNEAEGTGNASETIRFPRRRPNASAPSQTQEGAAAEEGTSGDPASPDQTTNEQEEEDKADENAEDKADENANTQEDQDDENANEQED